MHRSGAGIERTCQAERWIISELQEIFIRNGKKLPFQYETSRITVRRGRGVWGVGVVLKYTFGGWSKETTLSLYLTSFVVNIAAACLVKWMWCKGLGGIGMLLKDS